MKKNILKKSMAILMTLAMALSLLPAMTLFASAAADFEDTIAPSGEWTKAVSVIFSVPIEEGNIWFNNLAVTNGGNADTAKIYLSSKVNDMGFTGGSTAIDGSESIRFTASASGTYSFNVCTDSSGNSTKLVQITVSGGNTAPTVTATGGTPTFTENGSAVDLFSSVSANTNDSGQTFSGMTLTVSNVTDTKEYLNIAGTDVELTARNGTITGIGNYAVAVSSNTATVTLSGMTRDNTQMGTLIDGMTYGNSSDDPTAISNSRAITITGITDSGSSSNSAAPNITSTVTITPANDAPTVKTNAGITVNEASADNAIAKSNLEIADVDNAATAITYTLTAVPAKGTLKKSGSALAVNGTFTQNDINTGNITYTHDGSETTADSFKFTASDGIAGIGETTFAITVAPVNDAPAVGTPTTVSYTDTDASDAFNNTTGTLSATDADGTVSYYGIDGETGCSYEYNSVTYNESKDGTYGTLYVKSLTGDYRFVPKNAAINAVSANQSETYTVTATDNEGLSGNAILTVSITGANDTPTNIDLSNNTVGQSAGANAAVGTLSTTDADSGQTFTYLLVTGNGTNDKNNALFDISGVSLRAKNPAAMAQGDYYVYIRSTDSGNATYDKAFTITVSDNVAPKVSSVAVPANASYKAGDVMNFTVNFDEAVTVVTASGTPSVTLTIDGKLRYAAYNQSASTTTALVFRYTVQSGDDSKGNGIGLSVAALADNGGTIKDAAGNDANLTLNNVGDRSGVKVDAVVPDAPTILSLSTASDTGVSSSDAITKMAAPTFNGKTEANSTVTLYDTNGTTVLASAAADAGGNWSITSSTLSAGKHTVTAKATDAAGNISSASTGFSVEIDTTAPVSLSLDSMTVAASSASANATIATLSANDSNTITYALATGNGTNDADNGSFIISGNSLKVGGAALSVGVYSIYVSATDAAGNTAYKAFSLKVASGPTVTAVNLSYDDTAADNTFNNETHTISATANSGSISGYGIKDSAADTSRTGYTVSKTGTYGKLFVNGSTGAYAYVPTSNAALNAVKTTVTDTFTIQATDSAGTAGNTLTVTINGANDTPTLTAPSAATYADTVADDTFSNTTGTLEGTDRDTADTLTYGITGGTDSSSEVYKVGVYGTLYVTKSTGAYRFEPNDGKIEACIANYHEDFTVTASDGALTATQTYTVNITGVNDTPSVTSGESANFAENGTGTVYTATSSDRDSGDTAAWSLDGADKALFAIDSDGKVTFNSAPDFESKKDANTDNVYEITVIATDKDGLTGSKGVKITVTNVNEAPVISSKNEFSVVEGNTAAFTAEATDPEKDSLEWSIKDGADESLFQIDAGKGIVTFKTAPSFSAPTDANKDNKYLLDIAVTDGKNHTVKSVTVTVTQQVFIGGNPTTGSKIVEVNGEKQDAGNSSTVTTSEGQKQETIKVDDTKLDKILETKNDKPVVTLPANKGSDVVVGELNGQTVKNMEKKEAVLEIKTETVSYTLPASQINIDSVSSQIGSQVELKDIKVSVKIAEPSADTAKIVADTASKGNYQVVVKPVEFTITCTSGDKTVDVSKFNGYVERTVAIPDGVDPSKITTGIVLNADGSFSHVPTVVVKIDGKYYAKINSLTNSTYSVIYNPVTFTDAANHWAKAAINDMGSRMVVTGMGDGSYQPDRSITRAEFAAIAVRAMGLRQGTTESAFGDVSASDWFNGYVDKATEYGLITGYDSTSYGPNDTITREQAMAIIARAMKITGLSVSLTDSEVSSLLANYTDGASVSSYARAGAAACLKAGVVTGSSTTMLSPKAYVTRAEVAVMVERLLQKSGLI